jgi:DNA polymerase I-like protein with 3'-5' exonuclease and polymerase domains
MRVLVNYSPGDSNYLAMLTYLLKAEGLDGVGTSATMGLLEIQEKAVRANCNAILCCNEATLANLVPGESPTLDKFRGSRLNSKVPIIIGSPLSHLSKVSHGQWLMQKDLSKFKTVRIPAEDFDFTVLKTVDLFPLAYQKLSESTLISYDIETSLLNEEKGSIKAGDSIITSASWSGLMKDGSILTFVLPMVDFGEDHWKTDDDYGQAILLMRKLNALPQIKVMQNGMYDAMHSMLYHAEVHNWQLDTMGMAHSEFSELPKTLDFIASYTLFDYVYWKDDADSAKKTKDLHKFWAYNAKDTWHTLRIAIHQIRNMPAYARRNYAEQFKLVYPCLYCAFEGILIDNDKRLQLRAEAEEKLKEALATLRTMFADPGFNPGSWQQVELYVYKVFGAKKPKIGKSTSCTDEKNLVAVAKQHPLLAKLVTEILTYRENQKAIGTYFDFRQINSRLLYSLDPFGTETSRMASRASSMWAGTQVQNMPKYAKNMLVADEGYELVEVDNSQSEARCTAYCSQEWALAAALEGERDFYKSLGTLFFNIPYEEVTDFFRNKVLKKIVHGTNYMMGAKTFIENIGIQVLYETASKLGLKIVAIPRANHPEELTLTAFATKLLNAYHEPFPNVRKWYEKLYNEILTTGKLVGPLGNVRVFFGDITKDHQMLRGAVAHQPQNLSVTILNKGLWKVYKTLVLPSNGHYRLKAQVHDSILAQYKKEERDIWIPRQIECMTTPVEINGRTLLIPVEAEYGPSWKDKQKYVPQ